MSPRLDSSLQIHTLAFDLGLGQSSTPCGTILSSVQKRVLGISRKFGCKTLSSLLDATANEVGTVFREIHSDDDLQKIRQEFVARGELIFANLEKDLSQPDDFGITIALQRPKPWECHFVSIIDCRGEKKYRSYFTKWHELAHLLTLTPQMRLVFRRSHSRENSDDPEEKLMDVIAGTAGFLPDFLPPTAHGEISFAGIAEIKKEFCPDSSMQAATIGIVKAFPSPCILVHAELGLKQEEKSLESQARFNFLPSASPALRAVHATVNQAAKEAGIQFFKNWRVPEKSVISAVFADGGYAEAQEDLSWWSTSSGRRLKGQPVRVKAKRTADSVQALVVPCRD